MMNVAIITPAKYHVSFVIVSMLTLAFSSSTAPNMALDFQSCLLFSNNLLFYQIINQLIKKN